MSDPCSFVIENGIGVVTIDSPPVNALSAPVRRGLESAFRQLSADASVRAIVLQCAGRTFSAGADISEFKKPMERPGLDDVFAIIENGSKPVVAAIHGTALGGGYEFALTCHYRIAVPSARMGLPEVNLGVLPGGGGTQRLPRIVGLSASLELLTSGRHVPAPEALKLGMVDALAEEGRLRADAIAFAGRMLAENRPLQRIRDRRVALPAGRSAADICREFLSAHARHFRGEPAPVKIVQAAQAAAELDDIDAGLRIERELIGALWGTPQAAARQYYFFAEREAARPPQLPDGAVIPEVKSVSVQGAGPAAAMLAGALRKAGLTVEASATTGDLPGSADLVIEALDAPLPARALGMHLPATGQRLAEIVRGAAATPAAVAAAMKLARLIGRVPVQCGATPGLITGRMQAALRRAAEAAVVAGKSRADIDRACVAWGFPIGPFGMQEAALELVDGRVPEPDQSLLLSLLAAVAEEGTRLLAEGVAVRASDIDVACVLACGWPLHSGGPMHWAQQHARG
jgi:enoyl-CoA hydratase/carnithine racemase